jgi:hypothetical protein
MQVPPEHAAENTHWPPMVALGWQKAVSAGVTGAAGGVRGARVLASQVDAATSGAALGVDAAHGRRGGGSAGGPPLPPGLTPPSRPPVGGGVEGAASMAAGAPASVLGGVESGFAPASPGRV